jgi:hypothetical protein
MASSTIDFRLMVPQGCQGGSGFGRIDPGSTGSGYDDQSFFAEFRGKFSEGPIQYTAAKSITIPFKLLLNCRRPLL